jgi:hypothetical protein
MLQPVELALPRAVFLEAFGPLAVAVRNHLTQCAKQSDKHGHDFRNEDFLKEEGRGRSSTESRRCGSHVAVLRVDKADTLINNPLYPSQRVCLRFPGQPCEHGATSEEAQESRSCSFHTRSILHFTSAEKRAKNRIFWTFGVWQFPGLFCGFGVRRSRLLNEDDGGQRRRLRWPKVDR